MGEVEVVDFVVVVAHVDDVVVAAAAAVAADGDVDFVVAKLLLLSGHSFHCSRHGLTRQRASPVGCSVVFW